MAESSVTNVLVTGASGFIGLHTVLFLLQQGYQVRATVRHPLNKVKVLESLSKFVDTSKLEFAYTDLTKDEGWQEAVEDSDFVIHTASPYPFVNPKDENDLIIPARDGTLRVLRAAENEGVKRVVMLSTIGAIFDGHEGENKVFDESVWSNLENIHLTYHKSKTIAELAAWEFINSAENKSGMEMVAINPSNVFGPVLDDHLFTSVEWFKTLMHAEVPGVSNTQIDFVDVRDLVEVLVKALTVPEAAGNRFICNGVSIPLIEFAKILRDNFSDRGFRIPRRILPDFFIRLLGHFSPKVNAVARQLQWNYVFSTERAQAVFAWQPRPYKQTIIEMAESLIQYGLVRAK